MAAFCNAASLAARVAAGEQRSNVGWHPGQVHLHASRHSLGGGQLVQQLMQADRSAEKGFVAEGLIWKHVAATGHGLTAGGLQSAMRHAHGAGDAGQRDKPAVACAEEVGVQTLPAAVDPHHRLAHLRRRRGAAAKMSTRIGWLSVTSLLELMS